MLSMKFAMLASAFLGSLALAAGVAAAPLCPTNQGLVGNHVVVRNVLIRVHLLDRDNDRTHRLRIKDVWIKSQPGQSNDVLCISLDATPIIKPYFIQVVHTGNNAIIVDAAGNIDFKKAGFTHAVAISYNLSDTMIGQPFFYRFDQDVMDDICIVKHVLPKPACIKNYPGNWTPPSVKASSGTTPLDILSLVAPNRPSEVFDYTLYLTQTYPIDPQIVNQ